MISVLFLKFMIYAVIGWVVETVFCFIKDKKLSYRGLLYGPYLPIYGLGAVAMVGIFKPLGFSPVINIAVEFFGGMVVCSIIEYFASYILERFYGLKLWNYTGYPLNLHGRIWIGFSLCWGIGCVFLMQVLEPFIAGAISRFPLSRIQMVALFLAGVFIADLIVTFFSISSVKRRMVALKFLALSVNEERRISAEEWADKLDMLFSFRSEDERDIINYRKVARVLRKTEALKCYSSEPPASIKA